MRLLEAKQAFLIYQRGRKNSPPTTISTYDDILSQFIRYVKNKHVKSLKLVDIDDYADSLIMRGLSPKTRRNKLSVLRSFIKYLYIKDLSNLKPEQIELPKIKNIEANFLTTEEAQALLSVITNIRDRAIILTLLATWARVSELINMQLADLYKRSIVIKQGKGGEARVVFINEETECAISQYIKEVRGSSPGSLFQNLQRQPFSRAYLGRIIKNYAQQAGISKKVSPHTLRHTGATGYIEDGGRLESANQILGHKSIYTTMLYLHFIDARLHKDYDAITPSQKYTSPLI